jgi:hypothetical protein
VARNWRRDGWGISEFSSKARGGFVFLSRKHFTPSALLWKKVDLFW